MKTLIALLLIFFSSKILSAQNSKIDSLDRLINIATTDTGRINLVNNKINILSGINLDSAVTLGLKTLGEAKRIKYYMGEMIARQKLAINYCFKGDYKSAEEHLKYLKQFIKPSKDSSDLGVIYGIYGMMYGMQSKYDSSILFYEIAIGINARAGNKTALNSNYSNIAISYQQQSNFPQALLYAQKSLKNAEEQKNEVAQARILMNISNTYVALGDSVKAVQSFMTSIELAKKKALPDVELYAYTNLSSMYFNRKNWEKAYEFGMKAAAMAATMRNQGIEAASLSKAVLALGYTNKFSEAIQLARRSIALADSSKQPLNILQANSAMGSILKLQNKHKEAIVYFEKAILTMKDGDLYNESIANMYNELSYCYELTGNSGKALAFYKKYADINDSTRSKDNIRKATELSMNYEFDKKLAAGNAIQEKQNAEARFKQLLLLAGLVLTLVLAAGGWISFRNKHRANSVLRQQKEEIQSTLTQLKNAQAQLIQSEKMASLGQLTAGIAHEIQNPLNFVNNFSELNRELIEEMEDEMDKENIAEAKLIAVDIKENELKINHHGKRAGAIVKAMLQHSGTSKGKKEPTDINALADEYLRLSYYGLRAKDKSFNAGLKTNFDESLSAGEAGTGKIAIIPEDIGRALLNLFNNAFYSVHEKKKQMDESFEPTVSVSTKRIKDRIEIKVKDNGMGIPQKVLDKIYQPFFTTKPAGQGTGLGLSLSYDIIKAHGGELKVETEEGAFAEFVIQLPYGTPN